MLRLSGFWRQMRKVIRRGAMKWNSRAIRVQQFCEPAAAKLGITIILLLNRVSWGEAACSAGTERRENGDYSILRPRPATSTNQAARSSRYFSAVETLVKIAFSDVPTVATTVMIATAMPAAIRPYSIAVAPDSSARKYLNHIHDTSFLLSPLPDESTPSL